MSKFRTFRRRFLKTSGFLVIVLVLIIIVFVEFYAPYWVIAPKRNIDNRNPAYYGQTFDSLHLLSHDNIKLEGYWVSALQPKGTVLLVHGIRGFKEFWWWSDLPFLLQKNGFNVVAFDNRAHGQSGGEYCTYGAKETKDISTIIDYIEKKQPNLPIVLWGHSLGGCIGLLALAEDKRIDAGIIESTFTDMHQIVYDYKKRMMKGVGIRFLSDRVTNKAASIAGFDAYAISPLKAVKNISQPLFLSHGTADNKISFDYGKLLFDSLASPCKQFYPIEGARHIGLWDKGGDAYHKAIERFLLENI